VEKVNVPKVSKPILRSYQALTIVTALLILFLTYLALFTPVGIIMIGASFILLIFILPLFLMVVRSINNTRYVLYDEELVIDTHSIIGGRKKISYKEIMSVERTLIPIGLKLWGASFHGGYYRIPGLGKAYLAITNMNDGVLIKTKSMNYIISPIEPDDFINSIKSSISMAHMKQ
jgi:hypothetical protein